MKLKTFAIKDKALDSFGATFQQPTIESATRMFKDLVLYGEENNRYRRNPEDYSLYMVGEYDDDSATLTDITNVLISSASEIMAEIRHGENQHGS